MSREIKFRALFELQEGGTEWRTIGINEFHGDRGDKQISPWLQFTGLTDKNGADVYESDVIHNDDTDENCVVVFEHGEFRTNYHERKQFSLHHTLGNLYAVIGNIHQHPRTFNT